MGWLWAGMQCGWWGGLRCHLRRDWQRGLPRWALRCGLSRWALQPAPAFAPCSLSLFFHLAAEAGKCARRRTHFLCPAKESKQRKAAPRQRPCIALRCAALHSGQTCDGASLRAAWARAVKTVIWDGLQGVQPQQGCGLARMRQPQTAQSAFLQPRTGGGQAHSAAARQNSLLRSAIAPLGQRPRARSTMPLHAALQWLRRRHRPRRRCLKGWASRAIAALGPNGLRVARPGM